MTSTSQTETKIDLFKTGEANTQKYALRQERQRTHQLESVNDG